MTDARAVLFDLDGTLVDTAPDMGGALNDMLVTRQYPPLPAAELRRLVSHGSRALIEHGFGDDNEAATTRRIREFLEVYGQRVARESALFEHMDALLRSLESRGIPWGVVTNKPGRVCFCKPAIEREVVADPPAAIDRITTIVIVT